MLHDTARGDGAVRLPVTLVTLSVGVPAGPCPPSPGSQLGSGSPPLTQSISVSMFEAPHAAVSIIPEPGPMDYRVLIGRRPRLPWRHAALGLVQSRVLTSAGGGGGTRC